MTSSPYDVVPEVLIPEEQLQARVGAMAAEIHEKLGDHFVMVSLLKGAFLFTADLLRELGRLGARPSLDFMAISSYGSGTVSSGNVEVKMDLKEDLHGAQVLLVDDILDTGNTFMHVMAHLKQAGAREVMTCVLLNKQARRQQPIAADIIGFEVPDAFVVGYGIDWDNHFRELPHVGVIPEASH
uniref:Hypoxanthine phosphoribosyltransferase n=1 Tax=Magnetococcus massalia (strain MO-1) TaxID=451514 RepID=A0A1S7LK67_MAGMO|nr:Hypoxanthine-guanine phosphoribosyltransferase [Candidatus Magnetococcus massalia]